MEIKYLTYFQKALNDWNLLHSQERLLTNESLSIAQIEVLEKAIYNDPSRKFPLVLRELLCLAGRYCRFFNVGTFLVYDQKDSLNPEHLLKGQNYNPYFETIRKRNQIDHYFENRFIWSFLTVYESSCVFHFIYLDENENDPTVYRFDTDAFFDGSNDNLITAAHGFSGKTKKITLSQIIKEEYEYSCINEHMRPPYNENTLSSFIEPNVTSNNTKNLKTFYSLIANRDLSGIKYFIERGIDVSAESNQAIFDTLATDDTKAFDLLVAAGANPLDRNEKILEIACRTQSRTCHMIDHLLEKIEFNQTTMDRGLVQICNRRYGGESWIMQLVNKGANVNAYNSLGLQLAVRSGNYNLAGELVSDYGANFKVNYGFVLLFKSYMGSNTQKIIPSDVLLLSPIQDIIEKHELDLKIFYGENFDEDEFKEFPLNIIAELEKSKNTKDQKIRSNLNFWNKIKSLWS